MFLADGVYDYVVLPDQFVLVIRAPVSVMNLH